ncbi:MAG: protein arginine kinase [bacterium]|nr:protein arginine kinase [bacterium]
MGIEVLLNREAEWLMGSGPDSGVVVSSRVRLARNLRGIPFPGRAERDARVRVREMAEEAFEGSALMQGAIAVRLDEVGEIDRQFLVERHLISREHARGDEGSALAVGEKEIMSVMINEEDHLRLQALRSGFQLGEAYREVDALDDDLERAMEYAFLPTVGYLTSCPTNTGTGMRASVMLHLPGLVLANQIGQVIQAIAKLGLAVRGLYGEGTEVSGNLFQISNQGTLGKAERDIIEEIEGVINQIAEHEKKARQALYRKNFRALEDRVCRAYGLITSARIITSKETIDLLSALKLGLDFGLVEIDRGTINDLFIVTQPAHLQKLAGRELKPEERDAMRADIIRRRLKERGQPKAPGGGAPPPGAAA